jgi:hypothetical protein
MLLFRKRTYENWSFHGHYCNSQPETYTEGALRQDRRLAKDYERKVQTSETLVKVSMIRLMLKRLARGA